MGEQFERADGLPPTCPLRPLGKRGDWLAFEATSGRRTVVRFDRLSPNAMRDLFDGDLDALCACWPVLDPDGEPIGWDHDRARRDLMAAASRAGMLNLRDLTPDAAEMVGDG